jgi:hypothetical protein
VLASVSPSTALFRNGTKEQRICNFNIEVVEVSETGRELSRETVDDKGGRQLLQLIVQQYLIRVLICELLLLHSCMGHITRTCVLLLPAISVALASAVSVADWRA